MIPTLETLLERGAEAAPAVKLAADKRTVYNLTLALEGIEGPPGLHGLHGPLRVKVSPKHRGNVTSIKLDAVGETFPLSVTALFNAKLDARHAAPPSMPHDHYENVLRIIEARAGSGEVVVFVSGSLPESQSEAGIIAATRLIAVRLVELRLATQRTLTVVNITNHSSEFPDLGTPMYGGSDVLVGTIGRIVIPSKQPTNEHMARLRLKLLFEGGAWAVQQDKGKHTTSQITIAGPPSETQELSIRVQTLHHGTYACIIVYTDLDLQTFLLVVHDALRNAEPMLRFISWAPPGPDVDKAMALMRQHVTRGSELAIFAFSSDASQLGQARRIMRALYDLGLTAQQPHNDAHVVLCHGEPANRKMEAAGLRSLISKRPADLRQREIGPKKPNREPPEPADGPCTVS